MYLSHFKLSEKPFKISTDPKFLWLGEKHKQALETLRYGILHNDGYVVVTGNVGTGKTTLTTALVMDLSDRIVAGTISLFEVGGLDFLNLIALAYGLSNTFQSKTTFMAHFMACLRNAVAAEKRVVLIIDEAQRLTPEHLKELLHLSNIEENGTRLLNLIFVGQNEFNDVLMEDANKALRQRITVNYNLAPLTYVETQQYILHRLKVAQCKRELFTREALEEIFRQTRGVPRLINTVCDRALLVTYFERRKKVRPEAVRESIEQLRLPEETEFAGERRESLSESGKEEKGRNEIGQKIHSEMSLELTGKRIRKRPRPRSAYVIAFCVVVVVAGIIFIYLDREGYLQQYLNPQGFQEKVSRKITPARTGKERITEQGILPALTPLTVEKTALDSIGKEPDSSTLKKAHDQQGDIAPSVKTADGQKGANLPNPESPKSSSIRAVDKEKPKPESQKAASIRAVEKEKSKPKPKTVSLRSSVGQSGQGSPSPVSEERSSSKREENPGDKEKPALDSEKEKTQSLPSNSPQPAPKRSEASQPGPEPLKALQPAPERSAGQVKELEPDKVMDWLFQRRLDKK